MSDPVVVAVDPGPFGEAAAAGIRALVGIGAEPVTLGADDSPPAGTGILVTMPTDRVSLERTLTDEIAWVHVLAAGVDGFPFDLVGERVLTCSRGASAGPIAEFVLASMLAFEKDFPAQWVHEPPEVWNMAQLGGLAGRTLGLVGLGAIGTETARRALAFDMKVQALRRSARPSPLEDVELVADLGSLLDEADHVVLVAPATAQTQRLFDASAFQAMKPMTHLVNVSRGSLVDQEALLAALDKGQVAMASLDVVDPEPLLAGHPFFSHPRVHLSTHVSWSSPATGRATLELFAENFRRYRAGEALMGLVDIDAGY